MDRRVTTASQAVENENTWPNPVPAPAPRRTVPLPRRLHGRGASLRSRCLGDPPAPLWVMEPQQGKTRRGQRCASGTAESPRGAQHCPAPSARLVRAATGRGRPGPGCAFARVQDLHGQRSLQSRCPPVPWAAGRGASRTVHLHAPRRTPGPAHPSSSLLSGTPLPISAHAAHPGWSLHPGDPNSPASPRDPGWWLPLSGPQFPLGVS